MMAPPAKQVEDVTHHVFSSAAVSGDHAMFATPMELEEKCRAYGDVTLAERVTASHPTGYSLAASMERDGVVRAPALCSWLLEETRFDALNDFLLSSFGANNVVVMERQNDFCRFKLRGSNEQLRLSKVFERIERVKTSMHILEYSVSQTTLEQIFNQFASQQAEEKDAARGMMGPA